MAAGRPENINYGRDMGLHPFTKATINAASEDLENVSLTLVCAARSGILSGVYVECAQLQKGRYSLLRGIDSLEPFLCF